MKGVKLGGWQRDLDTESGKIDSDSLCTPPEIIYRMWELFGGKPDCDPCSNEHSLVDAKKTYTFGGLHRPWGEKTYENHPYSTNEPWINKAIVEMKAQRVKQLLILCMSATSTYWWQRAMLVPKRNPRVLFTERLVFLGPGGVPLESGARFDTSLIYYGPHVKKFEKLYRGITRWSAWGR